MERIQFFVLDSGDNLKYDVKQKKEAGKLTILEIIQKLLEEQNLDEIDPKKVIFLDEYGNEVVKDMHLAEFLGSLKMDYIDCEEKTDIKVFIFGDDYSSENDLTFVNQVWKKYENYADDQRSKHLMKIKEAHYYLKEKYADDSNFDSLRSLEQVYALIFARMNHLKKRENVFQMFERVRKVILKNHNIAVDNILINVKEYTKSVKEQLITLQNGVENIDTIFDKLEIEKVEVEGKSTLMDYFDKEQLNLWRESCKGDIRKFKKKIEDILVSFDMLRKASILNENANKDYMKEFNFDIEKLKEIKKSDLLFEYSKSWDTFFKKNYPLIKNSSDASDDDFSPIKGSNEDQQGQIDLTKKLKVFTQKFSERQKDITKVFKAVDNKLDVSRNQLKQYFFKSIMTTRDLIRKSGFIQLKIQKKTENKSLLLGKLSKGIEEETTVLNVLEGFNDTYYSSKVEIERRARFDFLMISFVRTMLELMKHENTLRANFLEKKIKLLPETFCPFLTNLLSCNILRQIEAYFKNDTRLNELDENILRDILASNSGEVMANSPYSMKSNIEGYLGLLENYKKIHKNLINVVSGNSNCDDIRSLLSPKKPGMTIRDNFGSEMKLKLGQRIIIKIPSKELCECGFEGFSHSVIDKSSIDCTEEENSFDLFQCYIKDFDLLGKKPRLLVKSFGPWIDDTPSSFIID